jgi:predicted CXXCH cytochrome family protein
MRRVLGWFVPIFVASAAAVSIYKMVVAPRPQPVPDDEAHKPFVSTEACMECHDPTDGLAPRSKDHPETKVCMDCH